MLFLQMVDIIRLSTINGVIRPLIGLIWLLHRATSQDTLHINARGVA